MSRQLAVSMVCSLVMAGTLWANAGPPPLPKDRKVAEPPVRFEGIDAHPDYVFHLYFYGNFMPEARIEVKDANPFKLDFKRKDRTPTVSYMAIVALRRTDFDKRKQDDPSLKWLTANPTTQGALAARLTPPETTVPVTVKEIPVTTYRVTLKDGKLSAEKVEQKKSGAANPSGLLPTWTIGIVSSLSIAWLGLWFARRGASPNLSRKGGTAERFAGATRSCDG
jgi:hypothetical protein